MKIVETINDALYELGVVDVTEEPTPEDSAYALRTLNRIMDGYNTQNLTIPYLKKIIYERQSWTMADIKITQGATGLKSPHIELPIAEVEPEAVDIIIAVPPHNIQALYFRDSTTEPVDYPLTPMTSREYAQLAYKGYTGIPTKYFIVNDSPDATYISFNAVPQQGLRLVIHGKEAYRTDFKPMDDVQWGTGVERMLMLRLAVELSPSYHIEVSAVTGGKAMEAENIVKASNYQPSTIKSDIGLLKSRGRGRYNPARI